MKIRGNRLKLRVFVSYTGVTILLYFVWVAMSGEWTIPLGPIAKIVEAIMIVLIVREP